MKIIKQSASIFPEETTLSRQIEKCARTAYESLDKIGPGSDEEFINRNIFGKGHWPCLDMGAVHFTIGINQQTVDAMYRYAFSEPDVSKYVFFDLIGEGEHRNQKVMLISGSPRALTFFINAFPLSNMMRAIGSFLKHIEPVCFAGITNSFVDFQSIKIWHISEPDLDHLFDKGDISASVYKRHKHVGASFTTSLNMTHQIVRHRPCGFLQRSGRYVREQGDISFIEQVLIPPGTPEYEIWEAHMKECEAKYFDLLDSKAPQAARTVLPGATMTVLNLFTNLLEWEHIGRLRTKKGADPQQIDLMTPLFDKICEKYPMLDIKSKPYTG